MQFEIKVQYGSVKISVFSDDKLQKSLFKKVYKSNEKNQYETIDMNNDIKEKTLGDIIFVSFSTITIEAMEDTSFSFAIISNKDISKRSDRVKYGIP